MNGCTKGHTLVSRTAQGIQCRLPALVGGIRPPGLVLPGCYCPRGEGIGLACLGVWHRDLFTELALPVEVFQPFLGPVDELCILASSSSSKQQTGQYYLC